MSETKIITRCLKSVIFGWGISLPTAILSTSLRPSYAVSEVPTTNEGLTTTVPALDLNIAQQPPNRDRFIQPEPKLPAPKPAESEPLLSPPPSDAPTSAPQLEQPRVSIPVRKIEVIGSTVFTPEQFDPLVKPLEGRSVSLEELQNTADAITQMYIERGYLTSRAVLVEQEITEGSVQIRAIEGRLQEIQIEGGKRLIGYVRSRIEIGADTPLRADRLEDQLLLLQEDPLIKSIRARLQPGERLGESILIVEIIEANPFTADFSADNYSPPILGSERFGLELAYGNVTGLGDKISASYKRSTTGESNLWDFQYSVPLNPMNGKLQLRTFLSRSEFTTSPTFTLINQGQVTAETFDLELDSDYNLYEGSFRQPFIRTPREELALSFGFSHREGQPIEALEAAGLPSLIADFLQEEGLEPGLQTLGLFEPELSEDKTSVFKLGLDYLTRDERGVWALSSQLNLGTGLFDATVRSDSNPDSLFFSWLFQVQRVQRLGNNNLLIISADLQLTPDSLLPSEQFVIGGGQSLRGYRQNVRFGDNGFRFSLEDRIALQKDKDGRPSFQIAPFVDLGKVWNNPDNPTSLPDQTFLAGIGAGLLLDPTPAVSIRLDFTVPLVDLDDRGNNVQDDGFYFSVHIRP